MSGIGKMVSGVFGSLFGGDEVAQPAPPPVIEPPPPMPVPDDQAVQMAKKRSIAAQLGRRGRQSTILTDPVTGGGGDALGG